MLKNVPSHVFVLGNQGKFPNYLEYIIDTDIPSKAPIAHGNADLWVGKQNLYYAIVKITRQFKRKNDPYVWHLEEYELLIHCDRLLPYNEISITFQQIITEFLGPANRLFGNIKIYKKSHKYKTKDNFELIKETPLMNIWTKQT